MILDIQGIHRSWIALKHETHLYAKSRFYSKNEWQRRSKIEVLFAVHQQTIWKFLYDKGLIPHNLDACVIILYKDSFAGPYDPAQGVSFPSHVQYKRGAIRIHCIRPK